MVYSQILHLIGQASRNGCEITQKSSAQRPGSSSVQSMVGGLEGCGDGAVGASDGVSDGTVVGTLELECTLFKHALPFHSHLCFLLPSIF